MFLHTLGINEWSAINWAKTCSKEVENDPDASSENTFNIPSKKRNINLTARAGVKDFLNSLPKVESHYCRQSSSKVYLESLWISKCNVFREYQKYSTEKNIQQVKFKVFDDVMNEMNISLFKPKKDQCDLCIARKEYVLEED